MSTKNHKEEHKEALKEEHKESHKEQPTSGKLTEPGKIAPFEPALEPYPQPEDAPDAPPWEKAEFKRRVLAAGFPGSPASDGAFLAALYRFSGGAEKPEKSEKK